MKPIYCIPTLKEIEKIKKTNGYTLVSTFSGCGGSSLGFEMAGYDPLLAHEFIKLAAETYVANHKGTPVDTRDIRNVSCKEILERLRMEVGQLDVLEGSPPCASFSTAGNREKDWGKTKSYSDGAQRSDDLFFEFARLLKGLQPKVFVAENVSGLVKGSAKGYFFDILKQLKQCGYNVEAKLLNAQWLGVPQARQRIIFIGVRNDLFLKGFKPVFPKPLPYCINVNEVLPYVEYIKLGGKPNYFVKSNRPSPTITASDGHLSETGYLSGGGWLISNDLITHDQQTNHKISAKSYHAKGNQRKYTIDEVKLLTSFPSDFVLTGNFYQRWERLGRSVPPLMMYHIAKTIQTEILDQYANS